MLRTTLLTSEEKSVLTEEMKNALIAFLETLVDDDTSRIKLDVTLCAEDKNLAHYTIERFAIDQSVNKE